MQQRAIKLALATVLMAVGLLAACSSSDSPVAPGDTAAPTIVSTTPLTGATDVAAAAAVTVTFSEAMAPTTAAGGNVTMSGGTLEATNWTDNHTLSITHPDFAPGAQVTVTIGTGLTDAAGNHLAAAHNFSFTVSIPDTVAPTVANLTPADGAVDVLSTAAVTVIFSEPMALVGVDSAITMSGGTITGFSWTAADTLQVQHDDWAAGAQVTITIGSGLQDLAGNDLAGSASSAFTVLDPDLAAPTVLNASPTDGATDVSPDAVVTFVFSEAMDQTTAAGNVTMTGGTVSSLTWTDDHTLVVAHADWTEKSMVSVTVGVGLADLAGNHLAAAVTTTFSVTVPDTTPPTLTTTIPTAAANDVATNQDIVLTFSEAMQPTTDPAVIGLDVGTVTSLAWNDDQTLVVHHTVWPYSTTVQVTVNATVLDLAGNAFAGTNWSFITAADLEAPNVLSTVPTVAETDVDQNQDVTLVFSEAMDQASVVGNVTMSAGTITGGTWSDDHTVVLHHDTWPAGTQITVSVLSAVQDLAGNPMGHNVSWLFTTALASDNTPPTIISIIPGDGDTDVAVDALVTVVFSESVDHGTADTNIILTGGITSVEWPDNSTAIIHHPDWAGGTAVQLTIQTGLTDLAGNSLLTESVTNFTVVSLDVTPPSVDFLAPADGDIDVPANQALVIVFDEPMDQASSAGNISLSEGSIDSLQWADDVTLIVNHADWVSGHQVTLTIATGLMDMAGNHLAAQVTVTFTVTDPDVTPPAVTSFTPVNGAIDVSPTQDVVIEFSELVAPLDAPGLVTMTGGTITNLDRSGPTTLIVEHDPWTPGATVTVTVSDQVVDMGGNAMGTPASTTFTVGIPDTTPPDVVNASPATGSTGIDPAMDVTLRFSEAMDQTSVAGNLDVRAVITSIDWADDQTAVVHHESWPFGTEVTVTVGANVQDLAGNSMGHDYSWSFTTLADHVAPSLISTTPQDGDADVALDAPVTIVFSEAMNPASTAGSVSLSGGITGQSWSDDHTLVLQHAPWSDGWPLTLTVDYGLTDLAGNHLTFSPHNISFTALGTDTTAPTVISTNPADGATGVVLDPVVGVSITFSEPISFSSLSFSVDPDGGHANYDNDTRTLHVNGPWGDGATETITVRTPTTDLAGNHLTADFSLTFTMAGGDTIPPTVTSITPADGATDVPRAQDVMVTFSEPVDQACAQTCFLMSGNGISQTVWQDDTTAILKHDTWANGENVVVSIQAGVCDLAGNISTASTGSGFTVTSDTTPPLIFGFTPNSGATLATSLSEIVITFSEAVDPNSLEFTEINGQLLTQLAASGPVWSDGNSVVTLPLRTALPAGMAFHLVVGSYSDLSGNANASPSTWDATVAGTADVFPVDDTLRFDFGSRSIDNVNPVWDGNWWSYSREFDWENAEDFRQLDLDTPTSLPTDWDYMAKTSTYIMLRGFREHDEQGGTDDDYMFVPAVEYMPLPLVAGNTWSGAATMTTPDGDITLNYNGEVFTGTSEVDIPDALQNKRGGVKTAARRFWSGCYSMRLYHDMITSTGDTMEVGVDTLFVAPGVGIVRESNTSQDFTDDSWSWDNDILFAVQPITP